MIRVTCKNKVRDEKGNIKSYAMVDCNGNGRMMTSNEIKQAIRANKLFVDNLQIDKAGRLVDKAIEKTPSEKTPSEKTPSEKTTAKTESIRQLDNSLSAEDKKVIRKKEVAEFLKTMNEAFPEDNGATAKRFIADYNEEDECKYAGSDLRIDKYITEADKQFIALVVEDLRNAALNGAVQGMIDNIEGNGFEFNLSTVNEITKKFLTESKCNKGIAQALLYLAAEDERLALIVCGMNNGYGDLLGEVVLTANYDRAKKFITPCVKEQADNLCVKPSEVLADGGFVMAENELSKVFILKYYAEVQKKTATTYRNEFINHILDDTYIIKQKNMYEYLESLVNIELRNSIEATNYIAIKYGFMLDCYDTDEEHEKILKEESKSITDTIYMKIELGE